MIGLAYMLDPYNVFHYKNIRDNGVEPNKNYIKMRYLLDNPHKFDSYLFGSSRVGRINVGALSEARWYNMTYSEGIPKEHFENLEVLVEKKIIPDTVLIGVDDLASSVNPQSHHHQLLRMPYPKEAVHNQFAYGRFLINYLNPIVLDSIPIIASHRRDNDKQSAQRTNWETLTGWASPFDYGIANAIKDIQSIIDLCNKNNIKLILFTSPLHKLTYQKAVSFGYIDFLVRLSDITDYYNFSGINDVTANNANYLEPSHYKSSVGDLIIDTIFYNKTAPSLLSQGFGYQVNAKTKTALFRLLRSQIP